MKISRIGSERFPGQGGQLNRDALTASLLPCTRVPIQTSKQQPLRARNLLKSRLKSECFISPNGGGETTVHLSNDRLVNICRDDNNARAVNKREG